MSQEPGLGSGLGSGPKENEPSWRPWFQDPTANVLSLVEAAIRRQDDLRAAQDQRTDDLRLAEAQRVDDLRRLERYFNERFDASNERLRLAESNRIDAQALAESRRIDALLAAATQNVALASEKQAAQAATLAAQVTSSAEALRAAVAATAAQTTAAIATLRESLDKRLSDVEQRQYQSGGREIQRSEGRMGTQWAASQLVTLVALLIATATAIAIAVFRTH